MELAHYTLLLAWPHKTHQQCLICPCSACTGWSFWCQACQSQCKGQLGLHVACPPLKACAGLLIPSDPASPLLRSRAQVRLLAGHLWCQGNTCHTAGPIRHATGRAALPGRVRSICRWVSISCAEKASNSEVPWLPSKATLGRLEAAPCNCWSMRRMPLGIIMAPGFTPVPEGLAPAAAAAWAGCIPLRSIMAGCMPCRPAGKLGGCQAQLGRQVQSGGAAS